ncbi:MAG: hypothetical protein NZ879_07075 [Archaeoglobaceae archaeon]|nr:hypothetical protein [Archaeoglobaceae archaeon]MDW8118727.1 hypothetical protein [Archaeoglobaceae archaeon]
MKRVVATPELKNSMGELGTEIGVEIVLRVKPGVSKCHPKRL